LKQGRRLKPACRQAGIKEKVENKNVY